MLLLSWLRWCWRRRDRLHHLTIIEIRKDLFELLVEWRLAEFDPRLCHGKEGGAGCMVSGRFCKFQTIGGGLSELPLPIPILHPLFPSLRLYTVLPPTLCSSVGSTHPSHGLRRMIGEPDHFLPGTRGSNCLRLQFIM